MNPLYSRLEAANQEKIEAKTFKYMKYLKGPTGPSVDLEELGETILFCSNNYLGLANDPEVVAAGIEGIKKYGAGTSSVRFICGTYDCHRELEERIATFLGTEAALTYVSCWNANEGLMTNLVQKGDLIVSDELNHASIIDATRLARQANRTIYAHNDLSSLEEKLTEHADSEVKVVITDGVFSMEGDIPPLPELIASCRKHNATLVVDDSHGTGVLGNNGRGIAEHYNLPGNPPEGVDIFTGTLGKALGGAAGGYVAGPQSVIDTLVQQSRPQLFSNALPPTVACSANKALEILMCDPERVGKLHANVRTMRDGLKQIGFEVLDSPTAILPIIIGETAEAIRLSDRLLEMGVFVVGFGFPVVPKGTARLRIQMSAAHEPQHIEKALEAFQKLKNEGV